MTHASLMRYNLAIVDCGKLWLICVWQLGTHSYMHIHNYACNICSSWWLLTLLAGTFDSLNRNYHNIYCVVNPLDVYI